MGILWQHVLLQEEMAIHVHVNSRAEGELEEETVEEEMRRSEVDSNERACVVREDECLVHGNPHSIVVLRKCPVGRRGIEGEQEPGGCGVEEGNRFKVN